LAGGLSVVGVVFGTTQQDRADVVGDVGFACADWVLDLALPVCSVENCFAPGDVAWVFGALVAFAPAVFVLVAAAGWDDGGAALVSAVLRGARHACVVSLVAIAM
jgi:hypothetical protein